MNHKICPECGFRMEKDGKFWYCSSWNCSTELLDKNGDKWHRETEGGKPIKDKTKNISNASPIDFSPMKKKQDTPKVGVSVFIEREDGKILMMLRKGSHKAGTWALPSGHIDVGETGAQTCIREVMEELGIKIDKVKKYGFIDNILEDEGLHYVTLYYRATKWDTNQEIIIQERDKIARVSWIDPKDPPEPVFSDNARKMIKKYGSKQKPTKKKVMQDFIQGMINKDKRRKEYFKNGGVDKDIERIKEFFKDKDDKCIDDEGAHYRPESSPLTSDEIVELVEAVHRYAKCDKVFSEADNMFSNESREYKGLIFRIMSGQGTCLQIWDMSQYYHWLAEREMKTVEQWEQEFYEKYPDQKK